MANKTRNADKDEENTSHGKDSEKIFATLGSLADAAKTVGKGVTESIEHTVKKEKARITKEEGSADLDKVVGNYTQRAKAGFKEFLDHPGATIGKAMLKGSAKVAKASGRSIGKTVSKKAGEVTKKLKAKPGKYLERELAQKELDKMTDFEKFFIASSYASAKKLGAAAEAGKKLLGQARAWMQGKLMNRTYKTFLPGANVLVDKVLQYYDSDSSNMTLDGEEAGIKYKVTANTRKDAKAWKLMIVSTIYKAPQDSSSPKVQLGVEYLNILQKKKDKHVMRKELESLVQRAIRDLDSVQSLSEANQSGKVKIGGDPDLKEAVYSFDINKSGSVVNLRYTPSASDIVNLPLFKVSYENSQQQRAESRTSAAK
ncbi:hypothetical protein JW756_06420 [Candidatus Woesearchaeota archaeon]|nr:hypothetical protein [Candidatus Woesearchaeota archaeon]